MDEFDEVFRSSNDLNSQKRSTKINNEPQDKLLSGLTVAMSIMLVLKLGSIPGGGQYFEVFLAWIAAVFIWLIVAKWVFKVNQRLACLEEIRDLAAESNRQDLVRFEQNETIKNLLRGIKDKLRSSRSGEPAWHIEDKQSLCRGQG